MNEAWEVHVYENRKPVCNVPFTGSLELGRQDRGEKPPYDVKVENGTTRLVLAHLQEDRVPRKYVRVDPQPDGSVILTNLSPRVPVRLEQGAPLKPEGQATIQPPIMILIEQRAVKIAPILPTGF